MIDPDRLAAFRVWALAHADFSPQARMGLMLIESNERLERLAADLDAKLVQVYAAHRELLAVTDPFAECEFVGDPPAGAYAPDWLDEVPEVGAWQKLQEVHARQRGMK